MTPSLPLVIEQCDRDAAAEIFRWHFGDDAAGIAKIVAGKNDEHSIVRICARHRLSERERAEKVAEEYDTDDPDPSVSAKMALVAVGISEDIRSGKEPSA